MTLRLISLLQVHSASVKETIAFVMKVLGLFSIASFEGLMAAGYLKSYENPGSEDEGGDAV
jgi:hypothetical protein